MNPVEECKFKSAVWFVGIVLAFLAAFAFLSWMRGHTAPESLRHARAQERTTTVTELRDEAQVLLNEGGWSDEARRAVRVPIRQAMERVVSEWENPEKGREVLIQRHQQATQAAP